VYYAEAWALVRYTIDRYASSESAFLRSLTDNDDVGLENLTKRAGTTPAALLGGKALSMYGDDYPGVASPVQDIRFPSWNLREIYDALHTALPSSFPEVFPLAPVALSFGTVTTPSISIAGGGAVWYELSGPQTAAQLVRLGDGAGQTLANNLRLAIVRLP
jgi:hypothetical protein